MKIKLALSMIAFVIAACVCSNTTPTPQQIDTATPRYILIATALPTIQGMSYPTGAPIPTQPPAQPINTPVPASPVGTTRDNPFPSGSAADIGSNMTLSVLSVVRPADKQVKQYNMFNDTPAPAQEYIQVMIRVQCTSSSTDTCNFSTYSIKAVGSDGQVHDGNDFIAGVPNELQSGEFFGGSSIKGNVVFLVPKGDPTVVLLVEPFLHAYIYIALQ